jgi:C-terminal processing protease CtpA/Prc
LHNRGGVRFPVFADGETMSASPMGDRPSFRCTFRYLGGMGKQFLVNCCVLFCQTVFSQTVNRPQYNADFQYFWTTIRDNYSYWDKKQTDWSKVKTVYEPLVDTVTTRASFVSILEKAFYEIYDHHASLNTNTTESQRLVPSGTDLWAEYVNGKPIILEVKQGSGADRAGIRAGMQLVSFNNIPVEKAVQTFLPKSLHEPDIEAKSYALRVLLAGKHSENRKITLVNQNHTKDFFPDEPVNLLEHHDNGRELEFKIVEGNVGYILINNSLGENMLISVFDSAMTALQHTRALIIDLRNTPSGGNTSVARAILGRFITKDGFYQKHELTSEQKETGIKRSWAEIVSPRKPIYNNPLVVLVDHWTGSVAEGIAIGFDALKRATIIGTKMAGLNGAVYSFTMPNTGIGFSFPAEKLFHVNGTPRENFKPAIEVNVTMRRADEDLILQQAMKFISGHVHK